VVEINLAGYKLSGIISPSFANLSMLGWMDLSDNQLTGIIPEALTSLANLKLLNLSHNNLQLRLLWKGLVQIIKTLENQRQKHE
jgi:Leucine-rich repeat (LRR) protein